MSESESGNSENGEPRRKKGRVNKDKHIKEKEKHARRHGKEFVTSKGVFIEAKVTGPECGCRKKCMESITENDQMSIIAMLYDGKPKNEQDTFLMACIEKHDVARHRPLTPQSKKHNFSFKYFVLLNGERIEVCRKAFISLHSISHKAVLRLTKFLISGTTPIDMRGKHVNRGNVLSPDVLRKIDEHINSFPKYSTHYTKMPITYLDATLTVRKMHDIFLEKHEDLKNIVKYEYFLKYFRENFGYRFGRPQVDVCSTCEELQTKIKSKTLNDNAKRTAAAEFVVHKRRANKFFSKLQEIKELSKARPEVMGIFFDFMQNLPLPHLPVQEMFYLRKLWYYVFNIFDLKNDTAVFYNYPEGIANKGPDEVASFILNFVENFIPNTVTELHVFSDACGGQNRNHTLCRVLTALTMNNRFKIIHQYFPIRGHSFMPCDRTFAVIKRAVRRHDRIYSPDQYKDIIESAKKEVPTYKVIEVKNEDILDCKNWWPKFFTKLPKSLESKTPFSISKCRHFTVDSERKGYLKTSEFIDAVVHMTFKLNKPNIVDVPLPTNRVYNGKVPIKEQKLQDLGKLIKYIPHDFLTFYEERRTWPTGAVDDDANEHE